MTFVVGDGKAWNVVGSVRLQTDRWNLVVIGLSPTGSEITVFNDAKADYSKPVTPADVDDDPISLGNWNAGTRPFRGQMKDFTWHPRPFTPEEIDRLAHAEPLPPSGQPDQ